MGVQAVSGVSRGRRHVKTSSYVPAQKAVGHSRSRRHGRGVGHGAEGSGRGEASLAVEVEAACHVPDIRLVDRPFDHPGVGCATQAMGGE